MGLPHSGCQPLFIWPSAECLSGLSHTKGEGLYLHYGITKPNWARGQSPVNLIHADHCAFFFFFLGKGGNVEVSGQSCREVWVFPPYSLGMGSFHLITGHRCLYLASHCWDNPSIAPHHTWALDGWMMLDRDLQTSNNWNMLNINFQPTLW